MKQTTRGGDPFLEVILGKEGTCTSLAYAVGATFVSCLVLAAVVAAGFVDRTFALGLVVAIVTAAAWWTSPAIAVVVAGVGFLFADGFVLDTTGTLSWHGEDDVLRLATMVCLAIASALFGHLYRNRRHGGTGPTAAPFHAERG